MPNADMGYKVGDCQRISFMDDLHPYCNVRGEEESREWRRHAVSLL